MDSLLEKIYDIHDVECNQKYDKILPYSFHLKAVVAQANKYDYLLHNIDETYNKFGTVQNTLDAIHVSAAGHDLIEDARMSYNDVNNLVKDVYKETRPGYYIYQNHVVDIIYACTEEKGKNRFERHSQKFFDDLKVNRLAVFIKLCDIMANVLYSMLKNSSMYEKYKEEFPRLKQELYIQGEYDELWKDLEKLLC